MSIRKYKRYPSFSLSTDPFFNALNITWASGTCGRRLGGRRPSCSWRGPRGSGRYCGCAVRSGREVCEADRPRQWGCRSTLPDAVPSCGTVVDRGRAPSGQPVPSQCASACPPSTAARSSRSGGAGSSEPVHSVLPISKSYRIKRYSKHLTAIV